MHVVKTNVFKILFICVSLYNSKFQNMFNQKYKPNPTCLLKKLKLNKRKKTF